LLVEGHNYKTAAKEVGTTVHAVSFHIEEHLRCSSYSGPPGDSEVINMGPLELGTNRDGSDFSSNPERVESAEDCRRLCSKSAACRAMTFVSSPNNLPGGSCWLKTTIPPPSSRSDMTSAVKLQ
jgi:hypothetical protein